VYENKYRLISVSPSVQLLQRPPRSSCPNRPINPNMNCCAHNFNSCWHLFSAAQSSLLYVDRSTNPISNPLPQFTSCDRGQHPASASSSSSGRFWPISSTFAFSIWVATYNAFHPILPIEATHVESLLLLIAMCSCRDLDMLACLLLLPLNHIHAVE
jgi:hypothetical protein